MAREITYLFIMTEELTAESWSELQDFLFRDAFNPSIDRFRSPFVFRGLNDYNYRGDTSLMRLGGDFRKLERHLIRNFKKYAHKDIVEKDSLWHWLTMAQHHGLPTRLLDWTYSPLVAMHFSTSDLTKYHCDSVIWKINLEVAHQRLPSDFINVLKKEGANCFTTELLSKLICQLEEFDHLSDKHMLIFFEPSSLDSRLINQYALFSVMNDPSASLEEWAEINHDIVKKIIIPARLKWEIRDKLDQSNVTERVLFPGLEGLSSWLKRHYSPRDINHLKE